MKAAFILSHFWQRSTAVHSPKHQAIPYGARKYNHPVLSRFLFFSGQKNFQNSISVIMHHEKSSLNPNENFLLEQSILQCYHSGSGEEPPVDQIYSKHLSKHNSYQRLILKQLLLRTSERSSKCCQVFGGFFVFSNPHSMTKLFLYMALVATWVQYAETGICDCT